MNAKNRETESIFGMCSYCHKYAYLKNVWDNYVWEGNIEVYGDMITQCFKIEVPKTESNICPSCIEMLRTAKNLKDMIVNSNKPVKQEQSDDSWSELKIEPDDDSIMICQHDESLTTLKDGDDGSEIKIFVVEDGGLDKDNIFNSDTVGEASGDYKIEYIDDEILENNNDEEYEDVEYLDESLNDLEEAKQQSSETDIFPDRRTRVRRRPSSQLPDSNSKWPKKLPKEERFRTYRQYPEEAMLCAINAVINEGLSQAEAALKYQIPKKTLQYRVTQDTIDMNKKKGNYENYLEDIITILKCTNVTPFKTKTTTFYCIYCTTSGPRFENGEQLREHTNTQHIEGRIQNIVKCLKPYWLNEILRVDILNLTCTICEIPINSWNNMLTHIKQRHNGDMTEATKRVIPFVLEANLKCVFCRKSFLTFGALDGHMNCHYQNYLCGECGDSFVARGRLLKHVLTHSQETFKCEFCDKTFTLEKYKKKHEEMMHKQEAKIKCLYCPLKFVTECTRQTHVLKEHKDKGKETTCEYCGKTYSFESMYLVHLRKYHQNAQFCCTICPAKYRTQKMLLEHILRHANVRNFACELCDKRHVSAATLKAHYRTHTEKYLKKKKNRKNIIIQEI